MTDRGDLISIHKKRQDLNNSSLETMNQNQNLSVESRSFVNRVNDQVRKRQKKISNVTENGEKQSMIWGMFVAVTMESAVFMGKNYLNNCQSIVNTTDITLKQMFDIPMVSEQDEISGLETFGWEKKIWKRTMVIHWSCFSEKVVLYQ